MTKKIPTIPVPKDVTDIVYYHEVCGGKATFGASYFTEVGEPDVCPNCGQAYTDTDQRDRIHRDKADTPDSMESKRGELMRKRDDRKPARAKPDNPRAVREARMKELRDELARLEAAEKDQSTGAGDPFPVAPVLPEHGRPPGIRLGP